MDKGLANRCTCTKEAVDATRKATAVGPVHIPRQDNGQDARQYKHCCPCRDRAPGPADPAVPACVRMKLVKEVDAGGERETRRDGRRDKR